ncbi:MAG: hypothetical protein IPP25_08575 [Saprospiraceae bacterium]|nr:hypothetical protein [Candidatus Opimibacter skivensis]
MEDLTLEDVSKVFQNHREGNTIEYKRDLQIYSEKETKEFLADVSSFANANGELFFTELMNKTDWLG